MNFQVSSVYNIVKHLLLFKFFFFFQNGDFIKRLARSQQQKHYKEIKWGFLSQLSHVKDFLHLLETQLNDKVTISSKITERLGGEDSKIVLLRKPHMYHQKVANTPSNKFFVPAGIRMERNQFCHSEKDSRSYPSNSHQLQIL